MNTRALITGITGMVGSHLADFLLANTDWDIYGMCRWRSPLDNVQHLLDRANKLPPTLAVVVYSSNVPGIIPRSSTSQIKGDNDRYERQVY